MSYLIMGTTVLTMIFGLVAYYFYKVRERNINAKKIATIKRSSNNFYLISHSREEKEDYN